MRPGQAKGPSTTQGGSSGGGALVPGNFATPSALVGLTAIAGSAITATRSDGAPALNQAIVPTWTGLHTFNQGLSVPDTMGVNSLVPPPTPPPNCTTGLDYYYDAPTYVRTDLWTPTYTVVGNFVVVRGTPGYYGSGITAFDVTTPSNFLTMTFISAAWTVISFDYRTVFSGRGTYSGSPELYALSGFVLTGTNIYVQFAIAVIAGSVNLRQTVRDQAGTVVTTDTVLGGLTATYDITKVIKITRPTSVSGSVTVTVDGVPVLTNDASGLTGASQFSVKCGTIFSGSNNYDGGATNAWKTDLTFKNIEVIGNTLGTSCTVPADSLRGMLVRSGTEIGIGGASDWTRVLVTTTAAGKFEVVGGITSLFETSLNGTFNKVNFSNTGNFSSTNISSFGNGNLVLSSLVTISGAATSWAGSARNGLSVQPIFTSGATAEANGIYVKTFTLPTAFLYPLIRGIFIDTPSKSGSATVTDFVSLDIESVTGAGTNNLCIRTGLSGGVQIRELTASQAVFTNASKTLVSNALTGTGNVVMSASPTLTGTIAAAALTLSTTLAVTGVATFTAAPIFNSVAASSILAVDASKNLTALGTTGTPGTVVLSAGPTFTGTVNMASLILSAIPRFNGTNSTGGGSALLATNCPAVTATAPYTWVSVITSDGSAGFVPVWK